MNEAPVTIGVAQLSWDAYERVVYGSAQVVLESADRIDAHRAELERQIADGAVIYSVNTGTGADANRIIPPEAIERVQTNTLRSHAVRVGNPVPESIARGMLLLKAQAYAQGTPGLRRAIVERLVEMQRSTAPAWTIAEED